MMPICQNCHQKWSWGESFKKSFTFGDIVTCPYCKERQYFTARMKKRSGIIPILVPIIMLINFIVGPSYIGLFVLLSLIPIFFVVYPFMMELSNDEQPLF